MDFRGELEQAIASQPPPGEGAAGADKKNYTEKLSDRLTRLVQRQLVALGLSEVKAPRGRDKVAGILLFEPGEPRSVDLAPAAVPRELHAESYCERLVQAFLSRNPFYRS